MSLESLRTPNGRMAIFDICVDIIIDVRIYFLNIATKIRFESFYIIEVCARLMAWKRR